MIRGVFIDPKLKEVRDVDTNCDDPNKGLDALYGWIGQRMITSVRILQDAVLWLDDEGLRRPNQFFFRYSTYDACLAGNGLILGVNEMGEDKASPVTAAVVKKLVRFYKVQPVFERTDIKQHSANHIEIVPVFSNPGVLE